MLSFRFELRENMLYGSVRSANFRTYLFIESLFPVRIDFGACWEDLRTVKAIKQGITLDAHECTCALNGAAVYGGI